MKKSISTFLKHPTKDNANRSANPPVTRASTILFNSMQELHQHEKNINANKKISYYSYGRYGSSTTIELENIIKNRNNISPYKNSLIHWSRAQKNGLEK